GEEAVGRGMGVRGGHRVRGGLARARADETVREPHPLAQGESPPLVGDHRVGAVLEHEAAVALRAKAAAETRGALEEHDVEGSAGARVLDEPVRRRESGDPAAHDDDAPRGHAACSRTTSASMRTKSGWSFTVPARAKARPWRAAVARASTSRSYSTST